MLCRECKREGRKRKAENVSRNKGLTEERKGCYEGNRRNGIGIGQLGGNRRDGAE